MILILQGNNIEVGTTTYTISQAASMSTQGTVVYDVGQDQMVTIGIPSPAPASSPSTPVVGRKRKHPAKPGKYVCNYCGRGCAKPSVLEKHIRAHTGERPYPCKPCGFAFKTKSNLYKHCKSRAHHMKVAGTPGIEPMGTPGQFSSVDDDDDEISIDSESAGVSANMSVEEITAEQVQVISESAAGDEIITEGITEITAMSEEQLPLPLDQHPLSGAKKDLKYYIVEVKDGDSLEEVVKRAKLAAKQREPEVPPSSEDMETVIRQGRINVVRQEAGQTVRSQVSFKPASDTYIQSGKIVMQKPKFVAPVAAPAPPPTVTHAQPLVLKPSRQVTMVINPKPGSQPHEDVPPHTESIELDSETKQVEIVDELVEEAMVIEPSDCEEAAETVDSVPIVVEDTDTLEHSDFSTSVTSSVERVNEKTVKVQIQLVPSSQSTPQTTPKPKPRKLIKLHTGKEGMLVESLTAISDAPDTPRLTNKNLTPEMVQARISELINMNQAIVNTPMADAPRPKRMSRQASEVQKVQVATPTPQLFIQSEDGKIHPLVISNSKATAPTTPTVATKVLQPSMVITPSASMAVDQPFLLPAGLQATAAASPSVPSLQSGLSMLGQSGGEIDVREEGEEAGKTPKVLTITLPTTHGIQVC